MVAQQVLEATEVGTQWETVVDLFEEARHRFLAQSRWLDEAKLHARVWVDCFPSCVMTCSCHEGFALSDSGVHPKGFEVFPPTRLNRRDATGVVALAMSGMPGGR